MSRNGADVLVESLIAWGVNVVFGMPGDGINGVMESIRTRSDRIRFIQVRHEESAAFMACAYAKLTGKLGCCLATTGPGGIHLLNGLYDAKFDRAPVLAITGLPYHDLIDTFTQQDVDHTKLFQDVALYTARIMSPMQVESTVELACRMALAHRGVAHVAIPVDVQEEPEAETKPSDRNVPHHASFAQTQSIGIPAPDAVARAAEILNAGRRIAILAGQGAYHARDELVRTAELLGAPIVKALLGKAVVPDDHPLTTGGIGLLGTRPSQEAFEQCDTLLIVGSTFPYMEYYPKPEQARGVQVDRDPTRIGLRFPVEVGLVGDARATLEMLNAKLARKDDRSFLEQAQEGMAEWRRLLHDAVEKNEPPMKPGRVARDLNERLADDAIVTWDSGHNTGLLARYVEARADQMFIGSGLLASMGCGIPYAVAAALAFPGRQVVAFVGDGGLSMLLGELATVVRYGLPIKIVVVKNNTLGQIKWEQMMFLGNPEYECDLTPIDFVKVAEGFGIRSFRIEDPAQSGSILDQALAERAPALVEAVVDPNDPLLPPKRMEKYAKNLDKALQSGTPGRDEIKRALEEEPARTMLRG
ncbi:thiamine pyrophosphate-dependent enzyme [Microvirga sesbaniae]|uniref:thiamine pyrophosphate-dependent enzyme n=1 Tax=Microvirga sesbaniae TaxID=681392 RepID=UPI0021C584F5|nr:thiamine pyrophosphate-dependent enzyme [Microvirga sp. HBU67692]